VVVAAAKSKTASRRIIPVLPALAAWLLPVAKLAGPVWRDGHEEFYHAQRETAAAAGVAWKANGLRHSFVSYRLASTQSAAQVSMECGNSPGVIFKHYRELVRPADARKWFGVRPAGQPKNVVNL